MSTTTTVNLDGYAYMDCPSCGDGTVSTRRAASQSAIPNGLRFLGVPCDVCAKTFTFEVVKRDEVPR
jgi:hypothetical protein